MGISAPKKAEITPGALTPKAEECCSSIHQSNTKEKEKEKADDTVDLFAILT